MTAPRTLQIRITCVATGESVQYTDQEDILDDDGLNFQWGEGNYSCDCNRSLFFHRAKGIEEPEDRPCGDSAYSAQITADGVVIYEDEPEEATP